MESIGWRISSPANLPFMIIRFLLFQAALLICVLTFGQPILLQQSPVNPLRSTVTANPGLPGWKVHTSEFRSYALVHGYNPDIGFIVNMALPSGKHRFFVVDLKNDTLLMSGLVANGSCNQPWLEGRMFSNAIGCGCSSLGHYRIGAAYRGQFGLAFKLRGLDTSNSNAYNRNVVLHSHECVPDNDVHPKPICESLGCPTVSPRFLLKLIAVIRASHKPLILWILE